MDTLRYGESNIIRDAVHLLFSAEKVKATQLEADHVIRPVRSRLHGEDFLVIPVVDLVRMKVSSDGNKDRAHDRGMDAAGVITVAVEGEWNEKFRLRRRHIRERE